MSGDKLISEFLQLDYDKELIIFRILDSRNENLSLKKPYNRYKVFNFYTAHEIELVFIHYDNLYKEFEKRNLLLRLVNFTNRIIRITVKVMSMPLIIWMI